MYNEKAKCIYVQHLNTATDLSMGKGDLEMECVNWSTPQAVRINSIS